jgi:hypothetical protein
MALATYIIYFRTSTFTVKAANALIALAGIWTVCADARQAAVG